MSLFATVRKYHFECDLQVAGDANAGVVAESRSTRMGFTVRRPPTEGDAKIASNRGNAIQPAYFTIKSESLPGPGRVGSWLWALGRGLGIIFCLYRSDPVLRIGGGIRRCLSCLPPPPHGDWVE